MSDDTDRQLLSLLTEIRDGQREVVQVIREQRAFVEAQNRTSHGQMLEAIELQRTAVGRQRTVMLIGVPAIFACIAVIVYVVMRLF